MLSVFAPRPSPPLQEIPIEVVVEKPPPPKPAEEKPKPPPPPDDEKPAYDAPSAATEEKANRESPDTKTSAPAAQPEESRDAGAPAESKEPPAAAEQKAQAAPTPQQTPPDEKADTPRRADARGGGSRGLAAGARPGPEAGAPARAARQGPAWRAAADRGSPAGLSSSRTRRPNRRSPAATRTPAISRSCMA